MPPRQKRVTIANAVESELRDLPAALRESPHAVLCQQLADVLTATTDARLVASISKELRAALDDLREVVARAGKRGDAIDELGAKRAARRGSDTAATGSAT